MSPPKSIDDYIAALPANAREAAEIVRRAIHAGADGMTEAISYGIPTFRIGDGYFIYFGAWKKHVGLYPIPRGGPFEDEIAPLRAAKDAIHLPYSRPMPIDLITRMVRWKAERRGG